MIDVRKMKIIMYHRRKRDLCEKCGKFGKQELNHNCLENYFCADTRTLSDKKIIELHNKYIDDINEIKPEPSKNEIDKKPVSSVKEIKEKLMVKSVPKLETKIKEKETPVKTTPIEKTVFVKKDIQTPVFLSYVVIENLTNYMDYDFLNFMSKYYNNRYYFVLLVKNDFINSLPYNMLNINKIINIHVKNIETENIDLNKLLEDSKCIFTNNQKIIQCCNELNQNVIVMPDKVSIETIKSNPNYWEIV
jgi:hypothetical protein